MLTDLKVKVGPQFYRYHEGALDTVPQLLEEYHAKRILVVHGSLSFEKAQPFLTFLSDERYQFFYHSYTGECSYYGAELITDQIKSHEIDFMIGVGGGKLADLVGYAAHLNDLNFGVIPTLASNCAPWTPLAVMYKENGAAEGKTEHFFRQAAFLITDPRLVIDAPRDYFIAGLADTLAKWYESESILRQEKLQDEPFLELAGATAKLCQEAIMRDSVAALNAMDNRKVTPEFVHLSEIIFAVSGLVGGLGDKYARNAAAHAMHDAMSKFLSNSHDFLHGEKVAYGIFYQLALEQKWSVIDDLIPFYQDMHLPMSLEQMGLYPEDTDVLQAMVQFIDSKEKVHLIPITISEKTLQQGIEDLEKYIREQG
ncbi:iron-containing alcohol dehydrogenase family protein [Enterococcus crotali]|uniref:iron-containing alcohol dehydrogenase family protein n=1 Tax=Enterococcus crotali TaxID=1453587 RepID=UPI000471D117|nr:iron-containing alcohol dehydrogenase family protein [Enterococcus crotali]